MADMNVFFAFTILLALSGFLVSGGGSLSKFFGILLFIPFVFLYYISLNVEGNERANNAAFLGLLFVISGMARSLPRFFFFAALALPYIIVFVMNYFDLKL